MLDNLPIYISIIFGLTTLLTLVLFHFAVKQSSLGAKANLISLGFLGWLIAQMFVSLSGFYTADLEAMPPRFLLTFVPTLILIIWLFFNEKGKAFIDSLPLINLTYLNVVRIPVELVLFWLAMNKAIPELMTFAGRNFDILAGITAPFIAYFGFQKRKLSKKVILVWNFVALGLLLFIVGNAILAAPLPFQQFAFDQPNIGVLYFPFSWLPAFVVPIVLFGHFVSIRRLLRK